MCRIISLVAIVFALVSCSTAPYKPYARQVKMKPNMNGVIAMRTDYVPEDRTLAEQMMTKNCGENTVTILEEGEVEVGTKTVSSSSVRDEKEANGFSMGGFKMLTGGSTDVKNKEGTSQVEKLKEWQINYNCTSVAKAGKAKRK